MQLPYPGDLWQYTKVPMVNVWCHLKKYYSHAQKYGRRMLELAGFVSDIAIFILALYPRVKIKIEVTLPQSV